MKLFLIVAVCIELVYGRIKGGIFPKCRREDPNLQQCLLNGVESIRPTLIKGIPEIDFPTLEPFTIKKVSLDGSIPGLKINGEATNIVVTGASNYEITSFSMNFNQRTVKASLRFPELVVNADYMTENSRMMLFFKINSEGTFYGKFKDVNVDITARAEFDAADEDGLEFLRVVTLTVKISVGRGSSIKITPQTKGFGAKVAATLANIAPTKLLLKIISPAISNIAGPIIKRYINNILTELPMQDVLED